MEASSIWNCMNLSYGAIPPQTWGPIIMKLVECPVACCPENAHITDSMREHFIYIHSRSKVAVLQEEGDLLPQCNMCVIHMPAGRLIMHQRTDCWFNNMKMRLRRKDVEVASWCVEMRNSMFSSSLIGGLRVNYYVKVENTFYIF